MNPILFTVCEKDYHYGVAAWVNSAIRSGYSGPVCVFHRGAPPPWAATLEREGGGYRVGPVRLAFHPLDPPRHLGYHKPFAALEALRLYPECDAVLYCDPDVVFLAPWSFFDNWISRGVAVCLDSHFPFLPKDHPWRAEWRRLLDLARLPCEDAAAPYANGGFFSVPRAEARFLEYGVALTEAYEAQGEDTSRYHMAERHRAVVGCQDLLAAALMAWAGPRSVLGPEGMGFGGYHFLLSHDIDSPKAWQNPFLRRALDGRPPSRAAGLYLEYANAPIAPYSPLALASKKATYRLAQLITRVWRR